MSENEFNKNEEQKASKKRASKPRRAKRVSANGRPRPPGVDAQVWKNRNQVFAKLTDHNFDLFYKWCRANDYNFNTALNKLISSHPKINSEFKHHA